MSLSVNKNALIAYGVAVIAIILDQLTKAWIVHGLDMQLLQTIELSPIFDLTYTLNTGVSFGMFSGGEARWVLSVFSILVAAGLIWWVRAAPRLLFACAVGLIIGGALGNVIDRVRVGAVIDFLDFNGLGFPWIFNVADAAISVGVGLLILDSLLNDRTPAVGSEPQKE